MGIAALVAINSFSENLQTDMQKQAKTLLGADLVLRTSQPLNTEAQAFVDSISGLGEKAVEFSFSSMVYFPKSGDTRLTQVTAVEGSYPFYGTTNAEPMQSVETFKSGQKAVVERTMMIQFGAENGDSVRVGGIPFEIEGTLVSRPGRSSVTGSVAPLVMIPMDYLEATKLVQTGSRVNYAYFFKLDDAVDIGKIIEGREDFFRENKMRAETVSDRQRGVSEAFRNLNDFLSLVSFIALLLGCIGVASAVHVYVKEKLSTVAVLRCLGVKGSQAFLIFLIQIAVVGLIGSIIGAVLGSAIQVVLPAVLKDFLPIDNISSDISWSAIGQGIGIGLSIAVLFALLPLLSIRKTSPLRTLRASYNQDTSSADPLRWLVYLLIAAFIIGFAYLQIGEWQGAIFFTLFIAFAFLLLAGVAQLIMWLVRRFFPVSWSFVMRQGLANLYRPNNQTLILMVSIGLGTALIATLFVVQGLLLGQVELSGSGDRPNMILFDIQTPQKEGVKKIVEDYDLPVIQDVPIVTTRLYSINGKTKRMVEQDSTKSASNQATEQKADEDNDRGGQRGRSGRRGSIYNREYRVTYRDTLIESEEIEEGEWIGAVDENTDTIPISIEQDIVEDFGVVLGDILVFNVQGALIPTKVASIRKVDWARVQTNFRVVFPRGVLEQAPQFHVIVSKVSDSDASAKFQQALVQQYPNVSAIDLTLILKTVEDILNKVSFVIRFMALFSILTGLLVLISSLVISKYQRIQESVLLRTLGASRRQIFAINAVEYSLLGVLAAFTGIGLSLLASWALAYFTFKIPFTPDWMPIIVVFGIIVALVVLIGLWNSRDVVKKPPLAILRGES